MGPTILYEDRRGPGRRFGLHELAVCCVFDTVDNDLTRVRAILGGYVPKKTNGQILRAIREDMEKYAKSGEIVFALIDADKAHKLLGKLASAGRQEVLDGIMAQCQAGYRDWLRVFLLDANTESLFEAIREHFPDFQPTLVQKAIDKDLEARDILLSKVANSRPDIRKQLRGNSSFNEFLEALEAAVRPHLDQPAESGFRA